MPCTDPGPHRWSEAAPRRLKAGPLPAAGTAVAGIMPGRTGGTARRSMLQRGARARGGVGRLGGQAWRWSMPRGASWCGSSLPVRCPRPPCGPAAPALHCSTEQPGHTACGSQSVGDSPLDVNPPPRGCAATPQTGSSFILCMASVLRRHSSRRGASAKPPSRHADAQIHAIVKADRIRRVSWHPQSLAEEMSA